MTDEVAHVLAENNQVLSYARNWKGQPTRGSHQGVEYRHVSVSIDRWIKLVCLWMDDHGWRRPNRPFLASAWCYRQFIEQVLADLAREAKAGRAPEIVHVQNFPQFVPMIRRVLPDAALVLHMHAEWLAQHDRTWIGPRMAECDSIIFCSDFFAAQARRAWPEYADKCHVVYNGVSVEEFEEAPAPVETTHPPRLLYVGAVSPHKGLHTLVDAFNQVVDRFPSAELKIVGPFDVLPKSFCLNLTDEQTVLDLARFYDAPAPYADQLKGRLTPAAAARTEMAGGVSRSDLLQRFKSADVLILPSTYPEGFGIPIVEAAAARIPAICTRRGGMPEVVVDGQTGLLVECENPTQLAGAICSLFSDDARRRAMGEAAHQRVLSHFTWRRIAQSLEAKYRGAIAAHASQHRQQDVAARLP